jgi:hypothetical protein
VLAHGAEPAGDRCGIVKLITVSFMILTNDS